MDGANIHFALCDIADGEVSQAKTYSGLDYPSLEAATCVYFREHRVEVKDDCVAITHPITGDRVAITNHTWMSSIAEMKKGLGLSHLGITSDFTAVSVAIPILRKEHLIQFDGAEPVEGRPIAVYGAGTGSGVAHLIHVDKHWVSLPGEDDHVDFAPNNEEEDIILEILCVEIGHVSTERVLSGLGPANLYHAIIKADNRLPENPKSKDITKRVLADGCTDCRRMLSLFCVIMGRFGGSLALNLGTSGGVFIVGDIVSRFLKFSKASGFRTAFEDKGRFKEYVCDIPVYLTVHDNPGLLGSGTRLHQTLGRIL